LKICSTGKIKIKGDQNQRRREEGIAAPVQAVAVIAATAVVALAAAKAM